MQNNSIALEGKSYWTFIVLSLTPRGYQLPDNIAVIIIQAWSAILQDVDL